MQGEISGIAGTDVVKNQLQTGQIDKPTIATALKESGILDVTLEEGERPDDNRIEMQHENCQDVHYGSRKGHQETQTNLCSFRVSS